MSVLLSAIKNAERTADPAEPLTPLLLQFLRAYVPVQQVLTHDIVILKEQNFRLRKLTGTYADWRSYNDARTALVAEMSTFVSEPAIFYDRYNIALGATPPEMRSAIAAKDYDDLIAGVEKSQDERMLRLGRVIDSWDGPCRQHAIPSAPLVSKAQGGAGGGGGAAAGGGGAVSQALPASGLSAPRPPRRAAAAAVMSESIPVAGVDGVTHLTSNACKHCGFLGHRVDNCPTVVYVAGGDGVIIKWADCYNCKAIGHISRFCPKPPTPVSQRARGAPVSSLAAAKNGRPPSDASSVGGSGC